MAKLPLVSIIIPTYNRAHLIGETLDSVLAQTYQNWECIVVDDGSTDNTDDVLKAYSNTDARIKYYKRPDTYKPGGNGARNYGFEVSKGKYVNWFDSDDLMHSEKLITQVDALEKTNFNFSICQTIIFEGNLENILGYRNNNIYSTNALIDFMSKKIVFLTQAPVFKKQFLERHSLKFEEELLAGQEWEFLCRVLFYSSDYHYTDDSLVYFRKHNDSISFDVSLKSKRLWNYYLARKKVKFFLNENGFTFSEDLQKYYKNFFEILFISFLGLKDRSKAEKLFELEIAVTHGVVKRMKIRLLMKIFFITGRGFYKLREQINANN